MDRNQAIPQKPGLFYRQRINKMLAAALSNSLTTIIAGPGYGKTQAVADFAKSSPRRVVWFSLSIIENETDRFWRGFCAAVENELEEVAKKISTLKFPDVLTQVCTFSETLLCDYLKGPEILLVIDNYNYVEEPLIREFFECIIKHQAANIRIILISGAKSDLHISKKLLGFDIYNIYSEDLRFTLSEITDYYHSLNISVSDNEMELILKKTEGWPLAVHLFGLQRSHDEGRTFSSNSSFSHISEMFDFAYFSNYPEEFQRLLVRLSMLSCFSLEMLKSFELEDLEQARSLLVDNIFITFDYNTHLLSFHNMYKEFLSLNLFILTEDEITGTRLASGKWFQKNNMLIEAAECFWLCKKYDEVLKTALLIPSKRNNTRLTNGILYYLELLPKDYREKHVSVDYCCAYLYLNRLEIETANEMFLEVKKKLEAEADTMEDKQLLGETYTVLGAISLLRNTEDFVQYFQKASRLLPNGSKLHNRELLSVYNNEVFFLPSNEPDQFESIITKIKETTPYTDKSLQDYGRGYELLFEAEGAFYAAQMSRSANASLQAIQKAVEHFQHDIVLNAYFRLLRIEVYLGDFEKSQKILQKISDYEERYDTANLTDLVECFYSWYYITIGDASKLSKSVKEFDHSKHALLPLNTGRYKTIHIMYLMMSQQYRQALAHLSQMEDNSNFRGLWFFRLKHFILKAIAYMNLREYENAIEHLWKAYNMAHQNYIKAPFIEMGSDMVALCQYASSNINHSFDKAWISHIQDEAAKYAQRLSLIKRKYKKELLQTNDNVRLTKREQEVLKHLATGLTRNEIAEDMGISPNGVKNHITGIYNKLGAINRADAIRIAMEKNIL